MSGKNPFWNYDYNAAQRNREIVDSYQQTNEARLNSQQAQFEALWLMTGLVEYRCS